MTRMLQSRMHAYLLSRKPRLAQMTETMDHPRVFLIEPTQRTEILLI